VNVKTVLTVGVDTPTGSEFHMIHDPARSTDCSSLSAASEWLWPLATCSDIGTSDR